MLEGEATGVLSEAFDIGYEHAMDFQKSESDLLPPDTYGLYGDNQWPGNVVLAGFFETYTGYCATVLELCRKMMRIFAIALDVPENYFDSKIQNPGVTSRMMHYPAQPVGVSREGLGAHTVSIYLHFRHLSNRFELLKDWECFTVLSQGKVPGLQFLDHNGNWILAPPIPGTLVVNIADCLSTW